MIICDVTHLGGSLWKIEHYAGLADQPARRHLWLDVANISSIAVEPSVNGGWGCSIFMKSGERHGFFAEYQAVLAGLIESWCVHLQFGKVR